MRPADGRPATPAPGALFDSHLHLDDAAFEPDREAVIARALAAGVGGFVTVGQDVATSRAAVALAAAHPEIRAAVGVHPHRADGWNEEAASALEAMARLPGVVAIGEIGLDFHRTGSAPERQVVAFRAQARLARRLGLPVIVHDRDAHDAVLAILAEEGAERVVLHAFSGSAEMLRTALGRGYAVGLGGVVTFKNARGLEEVVRAVPLDALLLETDAPSLAPVPVRGRRNEPAYLVHVATRIAALRRAVPEEVAATTTAAARRVFGLG